MKRLRDLILIFFSRPVVFVLKNPSFEANLVLSTLNPDVDSQSDISEPVKPNAKKKTVQKRAPRKNTKTAARAGPNSTIKSKNITKNQAPNVKLNASQNNREEEDRISLNSSVNGCSVQEMHLDANDTSYAPNIRLSGNGPGTRTPTSSSAAAKNKSVPNIFAPIPKRKSNPGGSHEKTDDDVIPCSPPRPPSKKARLIFQKCFKTTFDPRMLPGHDQVLAEDSDEEGK